MKVPKDLRRKWAAKLRKAGFKDLESHNGHLKEDPFLRSFNEHTRAEYAVLGLKGSLQQSKVRNAARQQYALVAGRFLNDYKHFKYADAKLWELHASGMTIRAIVKTRIKAGCTRLVSRSPVHRLIQSLKTIMLSDNWDLRY